jgi:sulfide:quinone oxidoreductase
LDTSNVMSAEDTCPRADAAAEARKPLVPFALSDAIAVGRQPTMDELKTLAASGFRSILNNRPDGEDGAPMTSADYALYSGELRLGYLHIPVEGRNPLEKDVRAFAAALKSLATPIFACCHSGGRSTALWVMASVAEASTDALITKGAEAGFDVSGLRAKMDMRREMLADEDEPASDRVTNTGVQACRTSPLGRA